MVILLMPWVRLLMECAIGAGWKGRNILSFSDAQGKP